MCVDVCSSSAAQGGGSNHVCVDVCSSSAAQGGGGSFRIETCRRGWLLLITDGRANLLMTERWLELYFLEWLQWLQWSPHPQLLDVVWCSAAAL